MPGPYAENSLPGYQSSGGLNTKLAAKLQQTTAPVSGGNPLPAIVLGQGGLGIYWGSGTPTITAPQGSMYLRTDGNSVSTRMYVNSSTGSGNSWTAVSTVA